MKHDTDCDCLFLNSEIDYHVRVYLMDHATVKFITWFDTVFSKQMPTAAKDFDFEIKIGPDGQEMLEVLQHSPMLTVDALESLFYHFQVKPELDDRPLAVVN